MLVSARAKVILLVSRRSMDVINKPLFSVPVSSAFLRVMLPFGAGYLSHASIAFHKKYTMSNASRAAMICRP